MSAEMRHGTPNPARILQIFGLAGLVLCLVCGGLAAALNITAATGLSASVCVGYTQAPHFQVGFSWYTPISSYLPPLAISSTTLCLQIPYSLGASILPSMAGQWAIPP